MLRKFQGNLIFMKCTDRILAIGIIVGKIVYLIHKFLTEEVNVLQGYTRRYTYNQLQVRPDNGKHR